MDSADSIAIFFWVTFTGVLLYVIYSIAKRYSPLARRYMRTQAGEPLEIDLRLTYKRFKELYPFSQITYREYKKLQMERAFKRAVSSEKNKRMVR